MELKIETIKISADDEVSFCPKRGGIITSLKIHGEEILYLNEETFKSTGVVRGGIPILFPNAGTIENIEFQNLTRHGFARDSSKWEYVVTQNSFKETLRSDKKSNYIYPYNFLLSIEGEFVQDGSFLINQKVENLEDNRDLPISMGLHPYFKIPQNEKGNIKFNFNGGNIIEEQIKMWANGNYISIDNPKIKNPTAIMEIIIPRLGTLCVDASIEYKKIWIWSLPSQDFICIEPVMRDDGGLVFNPEKIRPKETFCATVSFSLKK